jgi:hypothetical protein
MWRTARTYAVLLRAVCPFSAQASHHIKAARQPPVFAEASRGPKGIDLENIGQVGLQLPRCCFDRSQAGKQLATAGVERGRCQLRCCLLQGHSCTRRLRDLFVMEASPVYEVCATDGSSRKRHAVQRRQRPARVSLVA